MALLTCFGILPLVDSVSTSGCTSCSISKEGKDKRTNDRQVAQGSDSGLRTPTHRLPCFLERRRAPRTQHSLDDHRTTRRGHHESFGQRYISTRIIPDHVNKPFHLHSMVVCSSASFLRRNSTCLNWAATPSLAFMQKPRFSQWR